MKRKHQFTTPDQSPARKKEFIPSSFKKLVEVGKTTYYESSDGNLFVPQNGSLSRVSPEEASKVRQLWNV